MLAIGLTMEALGLFLLWVMFHGQTAISPDDAKSWTKSWADVGRSLGTFTNPSSS